MPWGIAGIATRISCPTTNSCKASHTHQDPDQLIGEKGPLREVFWDLIDVGEKQAYRGAKPTDHLRYRPSRARDSGAEGGETEPKRHANCDGTIIRLLRVLENELLPMI